MAGCSHVKLVGEANGVECGMWGVDYVGQRQTLLAPQADSMRRRRPTAALSVHRSPWQRRIRLFRVLPPCRSRSIPTPFNSQIHFCIPLSAWVANLAKVSRLFVGTVLAWLMQPSVTQRAIDASTRFTPTFQLPTPRLCVENSRFNRGMYGTVHCQGRHREALQTWSSIVRVSDERLQQSRTSDVRASDVIAVDSHKPLSA